MTTTLERLNACLSYRALLLAFWSAFWLLNGLDKFFNHGFFFGVTRDERFVEYFARLNLPAEVALSTLYACGVVEVLVGFGFLYALTCRKTRALFSDLSFKGSVLIFFAFSVGDILFGDRQELWEHATFLVLTVICYLIVQRPERYDYSPALPVHALHHE